MGAGDGKKDNDQDMYEDWVLMEKEMAMAMRMEMEMARIPHRLHLSHMLPP